jgi:hypothetical protein
MGSEIRRFTAAVFAEPLKNMKFENASGVVWEANNGCT